MKEKKNNFNYKSWSVGGSSGKNIRSQLEESLKRLKQDYVDIFSYITGMIIYP